MRTAAWALLLALLLAGCGAPRDAPSAPTNATPDGKADDAPVPRAPTLAIVTDPAHPEVGQAVIFQVKATGLSEGDRVKDVAWRFGDGQSSTERQPIHAYRAAASFTVTADVTTTHGATAQAQARLQVAGQGDGPAAAPPLPPPDINVSLSGSIARFSFAAPYESDEVRWSFGDGTQSSDPAPQHAYLATGVFAVSLELTVGQDAARAGLEVAIDTVSAQARVTVGVSDTGINPYHAVYYRPAATAHPCTYIVGYADCSIPALPLSVGPGHGSYEDRVAKDKAVWDSVQTGQWYWIPQTAIIAAHCPAPYTGDATDTGTYADPRCILDDTQTHGTQTTSSVLSEAPEAWLVFNEGSGSAYLADAPVSIDIESNSWGSLAPLYAGFTHAAGVGVCNDSIDSPNSIKFRSAGNNGPWPNMGDCWRNGYRTYSVSGGYPSGQHGYLSGSAPDFASYWCRPAADPHSDSEMLESICGTSFAAPTAAGTAAAALLAIRQELGYLGGSSQTEVAPGLTHERFMEAVAWGATYKPAARDGFPNSNLLGVPVGPAPWLFWGWGWLQAEQATAIVDCAMQRACPDNKSPEAWAFNDVRRTFAADA